MATAWSRRASILGGKLCNPDVEIALLGTECSLEAVALEHSILNRSSFNITKILNTAPITQRRQFIVRRFVLVIGCAWHSKPQSDSVRQRATNDCVLVVSNRTGLHRRT